MSTTFIAAALLFDMDSTLIDSTAVVEDAWTRWALAHDLDPATVLPVIHGRQGYLTMAELVPQRPHEHNIADNEAMLAQELHNVEGIVEIPGAGALISALAGAPHALVTSAPLDLATIRMGVAGVPLPPVLVTAESVTHSKPHPEGFVNAAAELGVDAADCVVFEDSAFGIQAGLAAGMRVVGVGPHAARHDPTWSVTDLSGIQVERVPGGLQVTLPA